MTHARLHTVVAMALLVISLMAHATFAAGQEPFKSLSALTVVDAHGTKVGDVISLLIINAGVGNITGVVSFAVGQQPFVVWVIPREFVSTGGALFNSNNCSGPPLVSSNNVINSIVEPAVVGARGHTVYVSEPGAIAQDFATFDGTQHALDGTCQPANFDSNISLLTARAVVDLDTLFTPPFSVR